MLACEPTAATVSSFSKDVHIYHSKKIGFGLQNQLLCLYFQPHVTELAAALRLRLLLEDCSYPSCDLQAQWRDDGGNLLFLNACDKRQFYTRT